MRRTAVVLHRVTVPLPLTTFFPSVPSRTNIAKGKTADSIPQLQRSAILNRPDALERSARRIEVAVGAVIYTRRMSQRPGGGPALSGVPAGFFSEN